MRWTTENANANRSTRDDAQISRAIFQLTLSCSFAGQKTVEIIIERKEEQSFCVHGTVLCAYSEEFKKKLDSLGEERKPLTLKNVSFNTFDAFVRWIYAIYGGKSQYASVELEAIDEACSTSDLVEIDAEEVDAQQTEEQHSSMNQCSASSLWVRPSRATSALFGNTAENLEQTAASDSGMQSNDSTGQVNGVPRNQLSPKQRAYLDLVDLYIFVVRYDAIALRRVVVLTLQRLIESWELLPCYFVIKRALDDLYATAPLCNFFAACCAYYDEVPSERFAELPSDFLAELLDLTRSRANEDEDFDVEVGSWCQYHEHEGRSDRKSCELWRKDDVDPDLEHFLLSQATGDINGKPEKKITKVAKKGGKKKAMSVADVDDSE